jgi:hypothetical protein
MYDARPVFWLQIVDEDGVVVHLPGGGTLEQDLIGACVAAVSEKRIGLWVSQATVAARVREGIAEAIMALKQQTIPVANRR